MFVDILFSTEEMKERKEGIRKEWGKKRNELMMWKKSGGERHTQKKMTKQDNN